MVRLYQRGFEMGDRFLQKYFPWRQIVLSLICLLCLTSCGFSPSTNTSLLVATEPAFPPFEFQAPSGELQGFDIDLMKAVGKAAGLQVQFQSLPFDGIIPALQAKTVGAAISGMTITAERAQTIDFSQPYFKAGLAIAVRENNTKIQSFDQLKNQKIAVQIGTTGAKKAQEIPGAQIRSFDSAPLALQELLNGNVEAVINDAPVTLYAIKTANLSGIKIVSQLLTEEFYGIATRKNAPVLPAINRGLKQVLANGTYQEIYQRWFNAQPPVLPDVAPGIIAPKAAVPNAILQALPNLLLGAIVTLQLTFSSVFLGAIAGSLIGIARLSPRRWLSLFAQVYVDFFRGTPLLVQIFMVYFGIPALLQELGLGGNLDRLAAAIIALSLNSAAYIAEIVRAGIQSIDRGQTEAARSLGMNPWQTMRLVIFPQAIQRMLPPLGNEAITLLKDTSLVAVIGFEELFRRGQLIVAENYRAFEIYTAVALVYLVLTFLCARLFGFLEERMNPSRRDRRTNYL